MSEAGGFALTRHLVARRLGGTMADDTYLNRPMLFAPQML